MPTLRVVMAEKTPDHYFEEMDEFLHANIGQTLPGHEVELAEPKSEDKAELLELLKDADFLVLGGAGQRRPIDRETFEGAPKIRFLQKLGTRHHQIDVDGATSLGLPVIVEPAPSHFGVAEHAFAMLLALSKRLFEADRRVKDGYYEKLGIEPVKTTPTEYHYNYTGVEGIGSVYGKTLGIIGLGDTGAELAKRAKGFGMRTIYYTRHPASADEEREFGCTYAPLETVFRESDFLSLHASHTAETQDMVNAETLALMKPTAYLVNTARGGLVDEEALYDALKGGRLAGAALDVFKWEPTPKDTPLLGLPNVIASPHIAVGSLPIPGRFQGTLDNVARAVKGEKLVGVINGLETARTVG
ncbi:MAG: D-glycerate dehydrogenase [Armatimonadetes bacterium CG_4_10_14_3_um_filter_66_18]|nr:D-glycerate dehydrogenase [Armatimonadota bacterium]OIP11579.1 MAG: hypothetical protein AUJ96_02010 [Armatimonadetes bacterium CG2_30_66_41]PIU94689.1 MAG: D-glycerate dehydrogenase [Armatimonadetes bacterium CG06_land_8_20_14_3_00_66_21]PIX38794.1 MAG: D-glycerate dehydrogenase [Armatimonadetes bacterium CG_4_8_14_3_um_filter_66_20]PIY42226.1 MAG: D-glycerate dehydrogenase [Armatimonadetes bacterium CG_4_10_14_3_um_filter_66_18]PJB63917.1 MAG: D-glycerate dehydrogenase [Armatimonadetes ba